MRLQELSRNERNLNVSFFLLRFFFFCRSFITRCTMTMKRGKECCRCLRRLGSRIAIAPRTPFFPSVAPGRPWQGGRLFLRLFFFFIGRIVFRAECYTRECWAIDECAAARLGNDRRMWSALNRGQTEKSLPWETHFQWASLSSCIAPTFRSYLIFLEAAACYPALHRRAWREYGRKSRLRLFRDAIIKSGDMIIVDALCASPRVYSLDISRHPSSLPPILDSITRSLLPLAHVPAAMRS